MAIAALRTASVTACDKHHCRCYTSTQGIVKPCANVGTDYGHCAYSWLMQAHLRNKLL